MFWKLLWRRIKHITTQEHISIPIFFRPPSLWNETHPNSQMDAKYSQQFHTKPNEPQTDHATTCLDKFETYIEPKQVIIILEKQINAIRVLQIGWESANNTTTIVLATNSKRWWCISETNWRESLSTSRAPALTYCELTEHTTKWRQRCATLKPCLQLQLHIYPPRCYYPSFI